MANSQKRYALISVFDKTDIVDFVRTLVKKNYLIISTGGTAEILKKASIPIIPIQEITGNPESFDGRMKTISFQIESGILYDRNNSKHVKEAKKLKILPIDIVVCNLYPFEKTVTKNIGDKIAVENIDVGGPTMVRAAAKNFENVLVIVNPKDYNHIAHALTKDKINSALRKKLAAKAFWHLSFYDSQIAHHFSKEKFPDEITIPGRKLQDLRYGENPHQKGAIYLKPYEDSPFKNLKRKSGRDLSHTNVLDINAGIESVRMFREPAAVVIKHNTPCGIGLGKTPDEALQRAIEADPTSAFGGVIVINKKMDKKTADVITSFKDERKGNIDIVTVPDIKKDVLEYLQKIRKSMGIYSFKMPKINSSDMHIKWIEGGFAFQSMDNHFEKSFSKWKTVTKKKPTAQQLKQMRIGWLFVSRVRSNSILVMDKTKPMTRGIGSGQTSRIKSAEIALQQAGEFARGSILVSDSFFPFDDNIILAAKHGISAIVQQGGSINDKASIEAADRAGITMVFTNRRAFWH